MNKKNSSIATWTTKATRYTIAFLEKYDPGSENGVFEDPL
jgi:hypothetical protein